MCDELLCREPCATLLGALLRRHLSLGFLGFADLAHLGLCDQERSDVAGECRQQFGEYFSPSWTPFQADRGRRFSLIVDAVSAGSWTMGMARK